MALDSQRSRAAETPLLDEFQNEADRYVGVKLRKFSLKILSICILFRDHSTICEAMDGKRILNLECEMVGRSSEQAEKT